MSENGAGLGGSLPEGSPIPLEYATTQGSDAPGMEQIRKLLFGSHFQEFDRRLSKQEERILQRSSEVESQTARSLSVFEATVKAQVDSLLAQLREEKDLRADADREIERSLREQLQILEKRVTTLSEQLSQLQREIAERMVRETQILSDEIKRKSKELESTMDGMFAELSKVKADRTLLSSLFVEMAKCLGQDELKASGSVNLDLPSS